MIRHKIGKFELKDSRHQKLAVCCHCFPEGCMDKRIEERGGWK